jgi:hypothetical protein
MGVTALHRQMEERMRLARVNDLADVGFAVHGSACEFFDLPEVPADWLSGIGTERDDLIGYAQQLRPCYDRLGRIIGQLAGLLILARLGGRFETDWTAVKRVVDQTRHIEVELHAVRVPAVAARHHAFVARAFETVASVTRDFDAILHRPPRLQERLDDWTRELKRAGAMLSAAAVERLGLMPIDFSQACCSCGVNVRQPLSVHD